MLQYKKSIIPIVGFSFIALASGVILSNSMATVAMADELSINKVELVLTESPPSGQFYRFYANGNQQCPLALKVYVEKHDPKFDTSSLLKTTKFYNLNTESEFGIDKFNKDGNQISTKGNTYSHGLVPGANNLKGDAGVTKKTPDESTVLGSEGFINGLCGKDKASDCFYLIPLYFMTNKIGDKSICVDVKSNGKTFSTCSDVAQSPVRVSALVSPQVRHGDIVQHTISDWKYQANPADYWFGRAVRFLPNNKSLILRSLSSFKGHVYGDSGVPSCDCNYITGSSPCSHYPLGTETNAIGTSTATVTWRGDGSVPPSDPNMTYYVTIHARCIAWIISTATTIGRTVDFQYLDAYGNSGTVPVTITAGW